MDFLAQKLRTITAGNVLDVATGKGDFLKLITDSLGGYDTAMGVDIDKDSLDIACERFVGNPRVKFRCVSSQQLPFSENAFDIVCISNGLHHMTNGNLVLQEMMRVCRSGGLMIVSEMYRETSCMAQEVFHEFHDLGCDMRRPFGQECREVYSRSELIELATRLNLTNPELIDWTEEKDSHNKNDDIRNIMATMLGLLDNTTDPSSREVFSGRIEHLRERLCAHGILRASQLVIVGKV